MGERVACAGSGGVCCASGVAPGEESGRGGEGRRDTRPALLRLAGIMDPDPGQGPFDLGEPREPASVGHSSSWASAPSSEGSVGDSEVSRDMSEAFAVAQVQIRKQNAITERERRKRISVSCERLRILLPKFEGRREDMASILEMAVQYLKLARTLVPTEEQSSILTPSEEVCQKWQKNVLIPDTRNQISEMRALDTARQRESPGCLASPVENSKPALMLGEPMGNALEDTCSVFEKELSDPALLPPDPSLCDTLVSSCGRTPSLPWPSFLPPAFPLETSAMGKWPSLVGICSGEAVSQAQLLRNPHEPSDVLMMRPLDTRSMSESEVEDDMPFLLSGDTDQWLGEQGLQDIKDGETQTCSMTTPFTMDGKTGSQEEFLLKSDLEFLPAPEFCLPESQRNLLDHLEFNSTSVALTPQEEMDNIFPYLFP